MNEEELRRLIDAYLSGDVSEEQVDALSNLLRDDESVRERFLQQADLHACMTVDETLWTQPADTGAMSQKLSRARWKIVSSWSVSAVLALVLLIVILPTGKAGKVTVVTDKSLGLLFDEAGAEFEAGFGPKEGRFESAEYRLQAGAIHLKLVNGTEVLMRSPATFRLRDAMHLELLQGDLRAIVPPAAEGFTVVTPKVEYEDLGTEFGVSVNKDSSASQIYVFDGEVNAVETSSRKVLSLVTAGKSMQFSREGLEPTSVPEHGKFLAPGELGLARWSDWRRSFVQDPSLIGFYSFTRNQQSPTVLVNEATKAGPAAATDGAVHGARWVAGRWPGKDALLFDRADDYVELSVPGSFEEISLSLWIKVDQLKYEYNALFNSDVWEPGDLHLQINRVGVVRANVNGKQSLDHRVVSSPIGLDQWQHVTAVISRPEGKIRTWVNGELMWIDDCQILHPLSPGKCRIGNWLPIEGWQQAPTRAFAGRIGELAIWKRPLTEPEIKAQYEAGRTTLLDDK